ncbi:Receptor protein-tyrosine kinase protein [Dioscorea alata]|uniref:Receptor protein-tyrosine kinase protein n=1 Tax=Dioscorea alata TaxID=55571 RepID=A0ACB7VZU4_DIOAL|nr:Receptor protein-tyrosine kinase protein [Dioscorea alata]
MKRFVLVFLFPCFLCCLFSICLLVEGRSNISSSSLSEVQNSIMHNLSTILSHQPSNANPNPCSWTSWVKCFTSSSSSSSSVVIGINLSEYGLSTETTKNTTFFSLLCQIDSLQFLNLSHNNFESLPVSFMSNCTARLRLKILDVSFNQLSGQLPNFSQFTGLVSLNLSMNKLSGKIDRQLHGLVLLTSLNLCYNSITGNLPMNLSSALEELLLSNNKFEGSIPEEMFKYVNLTVLDLSQNQLNGFIPDGIEGLQKLKKIFLSGNNLTGGLPPKMSMIKTLSQFAANNNNFNGSIPSGITTNLQFLDLSYNNLSGDLPHDLLSHGSLGHLDLTDNSLSGPIPPISGNLLTNLKRLRLGQNELNGSIPGEIGDISGLMYLELNDNQFEGYIPVHLQKCKNLSLLNLAGNHLTGPFPKELASLTQLQVLKLQMNNLDGSIPDEIYQLVNLNTLNLSQNSFIGEISPLISNLKKVAFLNLNDNKLGGQIPDSIDDIGVYLIELQLANNKFNGSIPQMSSDLHITTLNLSSNLFMGPLPESLSKLYSLEVLDLSDNNFTGDIPSSFTKLGSLTILDLSNNHLTGILPNFPKYVNVITTGNNIQNVTNPNTPTPSQPRRRTNVVVVVIAVVGSVVVIGLLAALLFFVVSQRFNRVEDEDPLVRDNPSQVINGCFITSNNTHRSNIDFMKAMVAVSNPENLVLKTRFATHYKANMANGSTYTVKKLNWGDKMFQMGSHEKFEEELQVLGKLSNSNVMVPLAYALTQDNAYLFYENVHKGTVFDFLHKGLETALDWSSRYSIALGVAQGLTFLHGCTQPVVLLDLSTKSIHLKSLKEPQIGDIELCKVIDSFKSFGSLSAIAGSVGYMPPEYPYTMRVTMAGNVYSFGVILLELLTGKPPVSKGIELAKWALSYSARTIGKEQILDSSIKRTSPEVHSQMLSVLKVALSCVCASPESRPKMRNVLRMLFNAR